MDEAAVAVEVGAVEDVAAVGDAEEEVNHNLFHHPLTHYILKQVDFCLC